MVATTSVPVCIPISWTSSGADQIVNCPVWNEWDRPQSPAAFVEFQQIAGQVRLATYTNKRVLPSHFALWMSNFWIVNTSHSSAWKYQGRASISWASCQWLSLAWKCLKWIILSKQNMQSLCKIWTQKKAGCYLSIKGECSKWSSKMIGCLFRNLCSGIAVKNNASLALAKQSTSTCLMQMCYKSCLLVAATRAAC